MAAEAPKAGVRAVFPPLALCQDNAAMIAALGAALYREGRRDTLDLASYPDFVSAGPRR
jgi:tRNA A37 threonylcarbamoyltransferase TsaD